MWQTNQSMLPLDDPRWKTLTGGYQVPYDASGPLHKLFERGGSKELWDELWQELHHQGDLGTASYAAVPHLLEFARRSPRLDWNVFGLIAVIELERPSNPSVPAFLAAGYFRAIKELPAVVGSHPQQEWDEILTRHIVCCIALARGQRVLARVYLEMGLDAAQQWLWREIGYKVEE
jgi:hypothetical protein